MNASPLIFLTHVGLLEVLDEPGVPVVVPDRVLAEIGARGAADPAVIAVGAASWIQVVPTPTIPKGVSDWGLDPGGIRRPRPRTGATGIAGDPGRPRRAPLRGLPGHLDPGHARTHAGREAARIDPGGSPADRSIETGGILHVPEAGRARSEGGGRVGYAGTLPP